MLRGAAGCHLAVGTSVSPAKPLRTASCPGIHSFVRQQVVLPRLRPLSGITRCSVSSCRSSLISSRPGAAAPQALQTCSITCHSPVRPHRTSSIRPQVITAARGDRAGLSPGDDGSLEQIIDSLPSLSVPELKQYCQQYSLNINGRKADLVARLEQYLLQELEEEVQASLQEAAPAAAAAEGSFSEIDLDELTLELEAEFAGNSKPDLIAALQSKGLPTDGNKAQLVTRLAEAVARDELGAVQAEVAAPSQRQPQLPPQQPAPQPGAAAAPADREWLVADKQQVMLDELLQMGVKREELVEILAEMGQTAAEDETLEDLAERASWVLAEEEVLLMEQQSAADSAATDTAATTAGVDKSAAASPSSILDGLTATDVNRMKVDDLRATLRHLGLSIEGTRYVMRDRLLTMLVVRRAATAGDMDQLLQQLSQMTLGELRVELERRGLSLSGTKAALEMRLAQTLTAEIMGPDAAAAMQAQTGEAQGEEEVEDLGHALLEEYDETETAVVDPAVTVAIICGVAQATTSQSSISSAAKLHKVTEALATANTLLDELHTAPLDPEQAAVMEAGQQAAAQAAADSEPPPIPVCGIKIDVYWADTNGTFYQLEATSLCGTAPADLAFRASALAVATFQDAAALAQHMAGAQTHAALSVLPGGALAMSGELATACEAAGTPLAAGAPGEGPNKVLSEGREPVLGGRSVVLQELRTLGYPTLPMLEVNRQEMLDQALELAKYLDKALTAQEEAMMVAAQPDSESLVDDSDSVAGGNRTSAILRDWNQRAEAADEEPAEEVTAVEDSQQQQEAEDSQQQQEQQDSEQLPQFLQRLAAWCGGEGIDPDLQLFTMGDAAGGEPLACAKGLERVMEQLVNMFAQDDSLQSLLIEPFYRKLVRWEAVVVSTAEDGPVSLLPAEVEHYNVLQELEDADLALKEWQMMQEGLEADQITQLVENLSATEPEHVETLRVPSLPDPMPGYTLKLHVPPRASTKITQTIRHAAAKAVAQLGLEKAGLVRVSGWMALQLHWQGIYTLAPEDIKKMPDWDGGQLIRMYEDELAARMAEPAPLVEYYDEDTHIADLTKFDPAVRCTAEGNGEGDVLLGAVELDVPLHNTSIAGIQALEIGLGPAGLARHLLNLALLGKEATTDSEEDGLLPPPAPPLTISSAQWAPATGANDDLADIVMQLAIEKVEERDAEDYAKERAAVEAERASFAALPWDEAVQDVLSGLTSEGMTEKQLATPPEEPEEWQPEYDNRSQTEINAERDALRASEDLAARDLRDDGLPHYGDQPIRYDRYASGDDWVPPSLVAAQAAAEGKPVPSIADFQREELAKQARRRKHILNGKYSEADRLPDVTDDEVIYYRLLGPDRYKGGVQPALQEARDWQKDSRTQIAVAAQQAAEEAVESGAEARTPTAAPRGALGGTMPQDTWPYPSEKELLAEAESRLAAPRVWVLMGGDGLDRQRCFRNGANIVSKLQRCQDLQVDAFLLPPAGAGLDDVKRRAALLARRTEWQALGIPQDIYPASMSDDALLDMPPAEVAPLSRSITVMAPHHLARHTVEEAIESAERLALRTRVGYAAAPVVEKHQLDSQYETQMELEAHYVEGVASSWGGISANVLPPAARTLSLDEFIMEANACSATVLLAVDDSLTTTGQLQQLLEGAGIGYTGTTSDFAYTCTNKLALSKAIDDIVESLAVTAGFSLEEIEAVEEQETDMFDTGLIGLVAMPKKVIKTQELLAEMEKGDHEVILQGLLDGWGCQSVVLKPALPSSGMGNIRIATVQDLILTAKAIMEAAPKIPPNRLSMQPRGATLPLSPQELLIVEPWLETDTVGFSGDAEVDWSGSSRWLEVSVGLLGEQGSMEAMAPTMIASGVGGGTHLFTPPPEHIMSDEVIEAIQGYAVWLADGLGLRSVACVDGFVNVDSGEMIVMDVKTNPPLTDGSPIFQQAALNDPPMLPYQLFRYLASQAFVTSLAAAEAAADTDLTSSSSQYYAPGEAGAAGFTTEDFDLGGGTGGDDAFTGAGGSGFVDDGVEDEDMEGLAAGWTR